jgi:hypothetical protein
MKHEAITAPQWVSNVESMELTSNHLKTADHVARVCAPGTPRTCRYLTAEGGG